MAFFDDVKKNLSQAGQSVSQKAKDLSESASLKQGISDDEKMIKDLIFQLGETFYEVYAPNGAAGFEEFFEQIAYLRADIEAKQARLAELNFTLVCPVCGDKLKTGVSFCGNCGFRIQQ